MNRRVCVLVLLALIGLVPSTVRAENLMAGVMGGITIANLRGEDVFNNSTRVGGTGGGFARYTLSDIFSVEPEVLFVMKGANFEAQGTKLNQTIQYLEIPILARATWPNESKLKPSIFVGPALGILLSNKIEDGAEIDLEDASRNPDFGIVFGAGLDYTLTTGCILLDARYELGLITTTKESFDTDVKTSVFSIMAGYGMRF